MKVAIVGGGVAGLSCAFQLKKRGFEPVVFERSCRVGGWVQTETVDGYQCEVGPAALRGPGPEQALLDPLGLGSECLEASPLASHRYLVQSGRLVPAPLGPLQLLRTPLLRPLERLRILTEPIRSRRVVPDETVRAFFRRRFGAGAARLADPVVAGVFAGDADRLSMESAFPQMARWEREHGSVLRGAIAQRGPRKRLYTFREGLASLPSALHSHLGDSVRLASPVERVERRAEGWSIEGEAFDALVLATPAGISSRILAPVDSALAAQIASIPTASVVVHTVSYPAEAFREPPAGFGLLVPRTEGMRTLGVIFESSLFPHRAPEGRVLLRVMAGGVHDPAAAKESPGAIEDQLFTELGALLGTRTRGETLRLSQFQNCLPQYVVGHGTLLASIEERASALGRLWLTGNSYRGVSVPDCIADGERVAVAIAGPDALSS